MHLGDITPGAVLDHKFTSTDPATSAPATLSGSPAVSIYKDNSTTQSTSGVTLSVDFDSVTGLNNLRIDTSADGTFYAAGSNFQIVVTTGTAGGTSVVGYVLGTFSIANRSALRPTIPGRTLDVSSGGEAGVDWGNVGSPTTSLALSGTTVADTQKVDLNTIKTNPVVNAGTVTFPTSQTLASTINITAGTITTVTTLTNLPAITANWLTAAGLAADAATEIAAAIWDLVTSGHTTSGTFGAAMNAAGSAGDPWGTTLPGSYASGTAGYILGTNLNATIASIKSKTDNLPADPADASDIATAFGTVNSTLGTIAGYIDTEVGAIKAKTDLIPASPAAVGDIPTANANAAAFLKLDWTTVSGEADRSTLNALRFLRNGFSIAGSTLTILKEDDTTAAYTRDLTTDGAALPITGVS
jgi:hypothetical protein